MEAVRDVLGRIRGLIKSVTAFNVWTRYALLAPWRLVCAAMALVTNRVRSGECRQPQDSVLQYAEKVFGNYKAWSGVSRFYGRVAEVGPGDVSGVAMLLLSDGCSDVDQIDRFTYNGHLDPRISRYTAPAETFFHSRAGYDFILSCAVMEHLYDPLTALRGMAKALNPGGTMVHVVDCRDHGWFSDRLHDLSFLRIPAPLYRPLNMGSGLNRVRLSGYVNTLQAIGFTCKVLVTSLSGIPDAIEPASEFERLDPGLVERSRSNLAAISNKMARPFRAMDDKDLMVSGFALVARRTN